ncbi:MAG: hypothetical protein ACOX0H_02005 [Patescibacteria group bacterium]|jgi:hypothetical protein
MTIINFLKNFNDYIGLITLLVGSVAIWTYNKQKQDTKRKSAKLILQEIRYAEQIIRNARTQASGNYSLSDKLLPTNNWHDSIHLFVKDLKESQIDLISRFYSQAQYLDVIIRSISDKKCDKEIKLVEFQAMPIMPNQQTGGLVEQQSQQIPIQQPHLYPLEIPTESFANRILKDVTNKIELIYNTPAVEKLIKISEKKWYQLL